jgi:hypothetical protein
MDLTAWVDEKIATVCGLRDGTSSRDDVGRYFAENTQVVGPRGELSGLDAYVELMTNLLRDMGPEARLVRAGPVDTAGDWYRFRWRMENIRPDWTSRTEGTDVTRRDGDGKVAFTVVFYDA